MSRKKRGKKNEEDKPRRKKKAVDKFSEFIERTRRDITAEIKARYDDKQASVINGGKQLRGVLSVLAWRAVGGTDDKYHEILEAAAAMEMMHGSSLILDDIFDGDEMRRGKPSLWRIEGISRAVLDAHHTISSALDIFLSRGLDIMKNVINSWGDAIEGERKDIGLIKMISNEILTQEPLPEELYFGVIKKKTASLFSAAAKNGAQVHGAPDEMIDLMSKYGENIGMAYQIADDLTDIKAGKIEGAVIIPLLIAIKGEDALRSKIFSILLGDRTKIGDMLANLDINPREFLVTHLKRYLNNAKELSNSDLIPESDYKPMLNKYPEFAVKSILKEGGVRVRL